MGTTLTGTTPQDTYDSLIKVTNNGPLSSTARYLSDGLGNDSVLALSTAAVTIGTSTALAARLVTAQGRVAISNASGANDSQLALYADGTTNGIYSTYNSTGSYLPMAFYTSDVERMRITSAGNVGIGTSSPNGVLEVVGGTSTTNSIVLGQSDNGTIASRHSIVFNVDRNNDVGGRVVEFRYGGNGYGGGTAIARFTTAGLCFNNDTAAANALDDYEEGTWTPAITAVTAPTGVTYGHIGGRYTKVGRMVSCNFGFFISSVGTGGSGAVFISGLPFTSMTSGSYQEPATRLFGGDFVTASYGSSVYAFVQNNATQLNLRVGQNVDSVVNWSEIQNGTFINAQFVYYV